MQKDELDLDILENADSRTIETLSERYSALSDSDVSRLFARSEELFRSRTTVRSLPAGMYGQNEQNKSRRRNRLYYT